MAFSFNGVQAQVTISGSVTTSASIPAANSAQTVINVNVAGDGNVNTSYTVPAGKTFYLYGMILRDFGNGQYFSIFKTDGTTLVAKNAHYISGTSNTTTYPQIQSAVPIWAYAAGELVKTQITNGSNGIFWGVLQ